PARRNIPDFTALCPSHASIKIPSSNHEIRNKQRTNKSKTRNVKTLKSNCAVLNFAFWSFEIVSDFELGGFFYALGIIAQVQSLVRARMRSCEFFLRSAARR